MKEGKVLIAILGMFLSFILVLAFTGNVHTYRWQCNAEQAVRADKFALECIKSLKDSRSYEMGQCIQQSKQIHCEYKLVSENKEGKAKDW